MFITFNNKFIRTICENIEESKVNFGEEVAHKLKSRLADISAIKTLDDLIIGNLRKSENKLLTYEIDLTENYIIEFKVGHVTTPVNNNGVIDKSKVSRIKILDIRK